MEALEKKRENRLQIAQWIFSYSLDFLMVILLVVVGCAGLAGGVDLLIPAGRLVPGLGYNLVLYMFLYGTAALIFKIGLLLLAGLTQIFSVRISRFPYREGRNPAMSFLLYGTLCQNARVRGALAFWIPMMYFAVWLGVAVDTRHFLVDERGLMEVFSFDALEKIDGSWVSDAKKGWVRKLTFQDGGCCAVSRNDAGADEIFRYAKQYWEMGQFAGQGSIEQQQIRAAAKDGMYYRVFYFVVAVLAMLFLVMYQMI